MSNTDETYPCNQWIKYREGGCVLPDHHDGPHSSGEPTRGRDCVMIRGPQATALIYQIAGAHQDDCLSDVAIDLLPALIEVVEFARRPGWKATATTGRDVMWSYKR
ncbi:MAG: hypothetical protein V3W41_14670 [Planctomycetota bacterium]